MIPVESNHPIMKKIRGVGYGPLLRLIDKKEDLLFRMGWYVCAITVGALSGTLPQLLSASVYSDYHANSYCRR